MDSYPDYSKRHTYPMAYGAPPGPPHGFADPNVPPGYSQPQANKPTLIHNASGENASYYNQLPPAQPVYIMPGNPSATTFVAPPNQHQGDGEKDQNAAAAGTRNFGTSYPTHQHLSYYPASAPVLVATPYSHPQDHAHPADNCCLECCKG
ncbi:hypothetical protein EV182_000239 [Spiromyces aspiralis]|uniref:Uncharacterized protein n=1 Tax=Spiromyces aspiralis TaxID=68401 RepID=A0ACC1I0S9_9FUNG|nr:hypothetical protein EV182_000239 [Spiromyces aspiralis]